RRAGRLRTLLSRRERSADRRVRDDARSGRPGRKTAPGSGAEDRPTWRDDCGVLPGGLKPESLPRICADVRGLEHLVSSELLGLAKGGFQRRRSTVRISVAKAID